MNIGQAAHASGISAKMIRYYESIGFIEIAKRRPSGYRQYEMADVCRLRFIRTARDVGLSFANIRELLNLWDDRNKDPGEIKTMALAKIEELQMRLKDVEAMLNTLRQLARTGKHGERRWPPLDDPRPSKSGKRTP